MKFIRGLHNLLSELGTTPWVRVTKGDELLDNGYIKWAAVDVGFKNMAICYDVKCLVIKILRKGNLFKCSNMVTSRSTVWLIVSCLILGVLYLKIVWVHVN
jgi:hypothetical protein